MADPKATEIANRIIAACNDSGSTEPSRTQVEAIMRPIGVLSRDIEQQVATLLRQNGINEYKVQLWNEANEVVFGSGEHAKWYIDFLLMDTCECVLEFLPEAIRQADEQNRPVDERIRRLIH